MSLTGATRTRVRPDHALLTPDTFVRVSLPGWTDSLCAIHISPEMGARFQMYTAEMPVGGTGEMALAGLERFAYVLEGTVGLEVGGRAHRLEKDGYAYLPLGALHRFRADSAARLLVIDKPYQPLAGADLPEVIVGAEPGLPSTPLMGDEALQVRQMLPEHLSFDLAVNTMTYAPGAHLPFVETHVMEHGLLMLEGGGVYRLADQWYPVVAGDVIWMAAYCPQWFGALGKTQAKYLIYKDINRHSLEALL
jgi:(S)-ureidoglycine aminohydrolase